MNNSTLKKRVERDFNIYVRDVLLELPENSVEDVPAILFILDQDSLEQDVLRNFLSGRQPSCRKLKVFLKNCTQYFFSYIRLKQPG